MKKLKRPKVARQYLERRIAKNQRRIQLLSEENYQLRKEIAAIDALPKRTPLTKADLEAQTKAAVIVGVDLAVPGADKTVVSEIEVPATAEALDAIAEAEQAQGAN